MFVGSTLRIPDFSSSSPSRRTGAKAPPPLRTDNACVLVAAVKLQGRSMPATAGEPGVLFYTHLSDQYAPFHTQVINATVRDATYVLDGLLYHESDLRIEDHYTDTAGFTDHVFALMHLLGYRFAPRIRDLADRRLYVPDCRKDYPALRGLIGGVLNQKWIRSHWDEILRLATSIEKGTVTASLMLRKLGSYPRQNGLAVALRELGRIERTRFTLDWLQNTELRRRVHVGLNKGEAKNALAKAVFLNRLGEMRDRSFENQRYRSRSLNIAGHPKRVVQMIVPEVQLEEWPP
jgi:TnpA family transposase